MTPAHPDPITARLQAAHAAGDWPLLIRLARQALRKNSRHPMAHRMLAYGLHKSGDATAAFKAYRQSSALWPNDAELLINHANLLLHEGRYQDALPILEKTVELRPDHSICWSKLAQCCYPTGLHQKGFDASQRALATAADLPQQIDALTQSAIHRRELGQIREAVQDCERAIALAPHGPHNYTNCLLFMLADPDCPIDSLVRVAHDFSQHFEIPLQSRWPTFENKDRDPWRKLKIGFVSPDFRSHAVMYFAEGLLAQLDRTQFEIFAFYLHTSEDLVTTRVQCHADHFIRLYGLTPQEQADAIAQADIDIVIDLAGHTGSNALLALAHKPAPVQVTTIGYPGTTGLKAMDWWLSDAITDPFDAQQWYTERLYRLPTRWTCYRPMIRNPLWRYQPAYQVRPTPALANGYVTFGSCNNLGKLTVEVLTLWGKILQAVPHARLLIEGKNLGIEATAAAYRAHCSACGIDPERLDLVALDGKNQYLTYHRIDIALDPFPLVGGTTTNDLLWMGTPLVTLNGRTLGNRMGVGSLGHLGLHEWIARSPSEYLEIATRLASDIAALDAQRQRLRQKVENSVLMREDVFMQEVGQALRTMWQQWLVDSAQPDASAEQKAAQIQAWQASRPVTAATPVADFLVGIAPGERVALSVAYEKLQHLLDLAQRKHAPLLEADGSSNILSNRHWADATELAERILCAKPHDPVALTVLAEIENAHGHLEFGRVYLKEALQALTPPEPAAQLLARTQAHVDAALAYLGEPPAQRPGR